jgi:hypothetical protein
MTAHQRADVKAGPYSLVEGAEQSARKADVGADLQVGPNAVKLPSSSPGFTGYPLPSRLLMIPAVESESVDQWRVSVRVLRLGSPQHARRSRPQHIVIAARRTSS